MAGATFMAAGSSGPELATAMIGVFVAKVSPFLGWADLQAASTDTISLSIVFISCLLSQKLFLYLQK